MTQPWPYPGDAPLARARRVARAYRERLAAADPAGCAELDALCVAWGETWVAPRVVRWDLDDWLTPAEAADAAAVSVAAVRQWRHRGRLAGRSTAEGWRYRARDVLALAAEVRGRPRRVVGSVDRLPNRTLEAAETRRGRGGTLP